MPDSHHSDLRKNRPKFNMSTMNMRAHGVRLGLYLPGIGAAYRATRRRHDTIALMLLASVICKSNSVLNRIHGQLRKWGSR